MKSCNENFHIVKKFVDEMDYYALLAGGAPKDEFDDESREIGARIHFEQSVLEIANIIAEVFNARFDERDDVAVFLPVAEQIKKELVLKAGAMLYEKSCGFIVYKEELGARLYLVIQAKNGEYGFPKGHTEANETEYETARRELKEETNLEVEIIRGFRRQLEYKLPKKAGVTKQSVYFLGKCKTDTIVCQETEVSQAIFLPIQSALELLSFENTKDILREADEYLKGENCHEL